MKIRKVWVHPEFWKSAMAPNPAICFLAGPGAAMITGQSLMVDGGFPVAQVIR